MYLDREQIEQAEHGYRTNLINSLTGFKSVALIGTKSAGGEENVAIFSQIIHVGAHPPLIGVLFRPHVVERHTLSNILNTGFYTINHISDDFFVQAHHTAARWEGSEFRACDLKPVYQENFQAPYVDEAPLKLGVRFVEKQDIAANGTHLVVGEIEHIHVPDKAVGKDGFVDLERTGTVTCSGLDKYHTTRSLSRLSYAKPDHIPFPIK